MGLAGVNMAAMKTKRTRLAAGGALALVLVMILGKCSGPNSTCSQDIAFFAKLASSGQDEELQSKFEDIYRAGTWGQDGNGSGSGSSLNATIGVRKILAQAIADLGITSMIDVPCGGMAWMPVLLEEVEKTQPNFRYMGLDIARSVVEKNKRVFRKKSNWRFATFDMSSQKLPSGYDLIHTRDALQHLDCHTIVGALRNLAHSGARYLLVGSYNATQNYNIEAGGYFSLNLRVRPYSLSKPLGVFSEDITFEENKLLLLYSIAQLAQEDFDAMKLRCSFSQACPECPR